MVVSATGNDSSCSNWTKISSTTIFDNHQIPEVGTKEEMMVTKIDGIFPFVAYDTRCEYKL